MPDDFPIESRFVIEARVGRGASGEVFKATDRETGLPVAVKRLLSIHDDAAGLDRFRREARLGLHALHEAGVVHRDVKPANVYLVSGEGGALQVKLIDLGIARAAGEATLTQHGVALGTPFYMAPEQARGEDRVPAKADQFSLGGAAVRADRPQAALHRRSPSTRPPRRCSTSTS